MADDPFGPCGRKDGIMDEKLRMVKLNECEGCPYMELDAGQVNWYADGAAYEIEVEVRCKFYFICQRIADRKKNGE